MVYMMSGIVGLYTIWKPIFGQECQQLSELKVWMHFFIVC